MLNLRISMVTHLILLKHSIWFTREKINKKSWADDASKQMGAKILHELTQLVATNGEETEELRLQAYVKAKGFETGGRIRNYGDVVKPNMVPWVQQTQSTFSIRRSRRGRDYASLESNFLVWQAKYEELKQMILSSQHQSSNSQLQHSPSQHWSPSKHQSSHSQSQHSPSRHQSPTKRRPLSSSIRSHLSVPYLLLCINYMLRLH